MNMDPAGLVVVDVMERAGVVIGPRTRPVLVTMCTVLADGEWHTMRELFDAGWSTPEHDLKPVSLANVMYRLRRRGWLEWSGPRGEMRRYKLSEVTHAMLRSQSETGG